MPAPFGNQRKRNTYNQNPRSREFRSRTSRSTIAPLQEISKNIRKYLVWTAASLGMFAAMGLYVFIAFLAGVGLQTFLSDHFGVDVHLFALALPMVCVFVLLISGKRPR